MIVYGRSKIMHSRYCPLKRLGMCGNCKKNKYALEDKFARFPIEFNDDCTITLLNSKTLNLIDNLDEIKGVNYFRLSFFDETPAETEHIIKVASKKLSGNTIESFEKNSHTHGYFFKNLL